MGFLSAVGSFISEACSVVGSAIASVADALVLRLPPLIEGAKAAIEIISAIISKVCDALGITSANENTEELGAKAMQEGTRPKTEEETTEEYLNYLRNDVSLDQEKFDHMTKEEKIACQALGTTMKAKCIEEKTGVEVTPEFLMTIERSKLRYEQVEGFINAFKKEGIESMDAFAKYISNDMSDEEAARIGGVVKGAIRELSQEMTDEEIQSEIVSMKKNYFSSEN